MSLFSLGIPQVQRRENQSPNKVIFYGRPTQVSEWCASHIYSNFVGTTPSFGCSERENQALTLDFKKRCVLESSPYMSMYVRRGKSSIPSTFSDILDKSFLNEQTSLCFPKGEEKKLDRDIFLIFQIYTDTYWLKLKKIIIFFHSIDLSNIETKILVIIITKTITN